MEQSVEKTIRELHEKAKLLNRSSTKSLSASRQGSSLHKIIRTKEQAALLMKLLKSF